MNFKVNQPKISEKTKIKGGVMRRILNYLRPYCGKMGLQLFIKVGATVVDLCLPWVLAHIIDEIIPQNNIPLIFLWGGIMLIFCLIGVGGNIIANRMASKVARDTTERLRHDLFEKIMYLSNAQIDSFTVPSLVSRMTTDTYNIHHMIGMMQRLGIRAPILLVVGVVVTLGLEPALALVLIGILPLILLTVTYVSKKGIPCYISVQQSVDQLVRTVRENVTGARVIKALSKTDYEKERFKNTNKEVTEKEKKVNYIMAITNPMMNLFLNMGLVGIIILGAYRVNSGITPVGKIVAFLTYFTIILNAMLSITRLFVTFSRASASAARIDEVFRVGEDLVLQTNLRKEDNQYHIEFEDVSFSYNKNESNISGISFKLKRGETLGIIGATGAGKTTLINLLMRFYDVDQGNIYINGEDVRSMPLGQLRRKFGVVFQNDVLFSKSIYENINFGRTLDQEDIIRAVEYAQAKPFVEALEESYEARLSIKGNNLSGGQKQRLLIARALAAKPDILVLDDSSSALDYKTDALLRKAINDHFEETTTIIVAQRISSIMQANAILVLDDGKILGYGTHEELIETCEIYREIYQSQMGGDCHECKRA